MQKPAPTQHPIHTLLQRRWSPRAFSEKPVPPDVLRSLFEAARWAPSSNNEQPWAFLVATRDNPESHARMLSTLVEFNQTWARHAPCWPSPSPSSPSRAPERPTATPSTIPGPRLPICPWKLPLEAFFVHQMAGFDPHKAIELFEIPSGWEPIAAFVIGYPGNPESLPDTLRQRETASRERKPLAEFVMGDHWGKTAAFVQD